MSSVLPTILTSPDGSFKIKIEIFPNGDIEIDKDYVIIRATLLSSAKYCYAGSIKCSVITGRGVEENTIYEHHYWTENESWKLPRLISRQYCLSVGQHVLDNGNLNILFEIFYMLAQEQKSSHLLLPSKTNIVEMAYVWTICNLENFPKVHTIRIVSTKFPSNSNSEKFDLELAPRGIPGQNRIGYSTLYSCGENITTPLLINHNFTISNYGDKKETIVHGPVSNFYLPASQGNCWGPSNAFLFAKILSGQCIRIEYRGFYSVSMKLAYE